MKRLFLAIGLLFFSAACHALSSSANQTVSIDPLTLGVSSGNGTPLLALAGNGNALAVWINYPSNIIRASNYTQASQTWSAFQSIALGNAPQVGVDGVGNGIIVYVNASNQIIATRFNVATSSFSALTQLSNFGTYNMSPQLSVNSSGNAVAIWIQNVPFQILGSFFNAATLTWSSPPAPMFTSYPADFQIDTVGTGVALFNNVPLGGVIQSSTISYP